MHRIVVVDDNRTNLKLIELTLREYEVHVLQDPKATLELLAQVKPHLLILDVMMPDIDGYELCRRVRAEKEFQRLPVLFLSARTDTESIVEGFRSGGNDYVSKPFVREELLSRVSVQLRVQDGEREHMELESRFFAVARLQAVASLAAGLNHEINNPLAVALANIELIKSTRDNADWEADCRKRLEVIANNLRRIAQIVATLQRYHGDGGAGLRSRARFQALVAEYLEFLKGYRHVSEVTLEYSVPAESVFVECSQDDVETLVGSLITNAFDAMVPGRTGLIQVVLQEMDEFAVLVVADNGSGIKDEDLLRIFDPFFTTKPPGKGLGLGLSIAQSIATSLGGTIEVASAWGEGSVFTVRLPLAKSCRASA